MTASIVSGIHEICNSVENDRSRLLDICKAVQARFGCVDGDSMDLIAQAVGAGRVEVEAVVSFYAFLSTEKKGRIVIRLCNDIIDKMKGADAVGAALCEELGIDFNQTTQDGAFTLEWTPCIGLCDQAPAALVNEVPITELTPDLARQIIRELRAHKDPKKLIHNTGDGNNGHPLIHSMVRNNIRNAGPFIFSPYHRGKALHNAIGMEPKDVCATIEKAKLRGRGGAGFSTAMKWKFAADAPGEQKYVICNADEGEPGTFKDRVILTERADRVFAGMTIVGYAIGASKGILYLRQEYAYLRKFLENDLELRRRDGLMGKNVCGHEGFDFDIRIQMGAGAYVCGEETALISSCEGLRGDPKTRPPFPAQKGYLGCPTIVNNVETLCKVTKIIQEGPASFAMYGKGNSTGTKMLSISGDCARPGVYEVPFGVSVQTILDLSGGEDAIGVQVSGPSGRMVEPENFHREISFEDVPTGGSIMIFGPGRNLLDVVHAFMEFFCEESCGFCTPCRVGNVLMKEQLEKLMAGHGSLEDLEYLKNLGKTIKATSRCGLGETSPNPMLTTIENYPELYTSLLKEPDPGLRASFNVRDALTEAEDLAGRSSRHFPSKKQEVMQ